MILGVGTDIVEMKHFKGVLQKTPVCIQRLFTPKEQENAQKLSGDRKIAYYAKRYAAKEALSKACGTGIGSAIGWLDLEILNNADGAPIVNLSPKAICFLEKKYKAKKIFPFISLSDEKEVVIAFAVLEK
ncbi:MAG: holo-ACP synthase [Alphaproteobacteria bacterium]